MGLSVAIVAHNEEKNIARTLEAVRWADEIVLMDSGSTDRTCDIAREYGAKVIHEPWRGYVAQKNYVLEFCTQDWVLALDADEEVTPGLAEEVRKAVAANLDQGYAIPRKNLFMGRWMRFGGFYPDPKLRLFRCGDGYSTGHDPHDRYELKSGRPVVRTKNPMIHYTYPTLTLYLDHMNRYSSLGAKKVVGKRPRGFSFIDIVLRPVFTFIYNYFVRLGFLDGREGLLLHMYHAVYVSWKYSKAWEMSREKQL
ncbi:MAG TPA: glycosyltransferase family 2 protein [Terriglobales bacterium]|nr:glycosyltransferase family 2 protein [Terriglobales bacterium]